MQWDIQAFYFFNGFAGQSDFFDGVVVFLASYLPYILPVILLVLVGVSAYSLREKLEILLTAATAAVVARAGITEAIRYFYPRPRPFSALPDVHALFTDSAWSFPSGHATFFFALSTAVFLHNRRWGTGFFIASALIALGRVAAGVHYPSDILGGALIGVFTGYFVYIAARKLSSKNQNQTY